MGIRMRNCIGWGLDVSELDKTILCDFEELESEDRFAAWREDVLQYAKNHDDIMEKMMFHEQMPRATALYQMVQFDEEFGFEGKLLLVPNGYQKLWMRYGDLLDIFEYEAMKPVEDWGLSEWVEKPGTLYPFVGLMRANPDKPLGYEEYWEPCYLNREDMRHAIPKAPAHLWFLIKHLELVPADKITETFLKLRPTFYRYFS